jgi:acyl carrier protein
VTANETIDAVYAILSGRNPEVELRPDLPLGEGGLNLDSIALVEVLLDCEDQLGVTVAAEMLGQSNLTVGWLVERIDALARR